MDQTTTEQPVQLERGEASTLQEKEEAKEV